MGRQRKAESPLWGDVHAETLADGNHRGAVSAHKCRREVERIEDAELVAKRYKRYARPRAERQTGRPQIRQAASCMHEPPVDGADGNATPLKKKPSLNTATCPQAEAADRTTMTQTIT